ncbi:glycosyltransferase [Gallaecimonas mangrovi]|uniref:glycosyltransferase n=1 Tax=Gallaecimonas mangrovi TaxID=2291597 RepID=UPI000E202B80|nr:glycosyltransferase [Gallaecimonas mangrovi]
MEKEYKKIDISIIVPVYNCEQYLDLFFDALNQQVDISYEVIFINDGSTDDSLNKLNYFKQKHDNCTVIDQKNQGVSVARNVGLNVACGEWIYFADADDFLDSKQLGLWLCKAKENELDCLIGNGFSFKELDTYDRSNILLKKQPWGRILSGREWIISAVNAKEWPHFCWLQLTKRSLIETNKLRFAEGKTQDVHTDILWTTELALVCQRLGFYKDPTYGYRISNTSSLTKDASHSGAMKRIKSYQLIISAILALSLKEKELVKVALLQQMKRELREMISLMMKKLSPSSERRHLAREIIKKGMLKILFIRPLKFSELWKAIRYSFIIYYFRVMG